ncbi:FkbM family methyltransferase [Thiocapsa sp.]|uniref:FkbM family methyltransferase n=1 Tax=Thiocapsa sp. TaxID=2024551 RepID=UPI0025E63864|nr:FkbM family methyltransferase [Thiocapsa sp.]
MSLPFQALRYRIKGRLSWLRVPVRRGPLQGMRISVFSGIRYVRGDYDAKSVRRMLEALSEGDVVYDIGAHIGYYTLAAAGHVGSEGMVYAFEPLPLNQRFLTGHLQANAVSNVRLVGACVGAAPGTARFDRGQGSGRGRLSDHGPLEVTVVTLDDVLQAGDIRPPTLLKIDVEGAEYDVLQGAGALLQRHRPSILLSVHSEHLRRQCRSWLAALGYEFDPALKPNLLFARMPITDP